MRYTFHLTTVTDLFASGANKEVAELRPTEFHNLMRFWFRAMLGKFVGNDLAALHRLESAAFGSTEASSPFVPRIANIPEQRFAGTNVPLPPGKAYLGFSLFKPVDGQGRLTRSCIPAGETSL